MLVTIQNCDFVSFITENRPDIQLKLPINRSTFDTGCDQGYASERSPEDEVPPLFPPFRGPAYHSMQHNTQPQWEYDGRNPCDYSFITPGESKVFSSSIRWGLLDLK